MANLNGRWIIAVHGGAGFHNPASEKSVKRALRSACASVVATACLESTNSIRVVKQAICCLEDDACLNAGYGSNLTFDGEVECDAAIMGGSTLAFGSVGALEGVKNPIAAARAVMESSQKPQPLGRVAPLTLVGNGAYDFAHKSGLRLADSAELITVEAKQEWEKWRTRYENANTGVPENEKIENKGLSDAQNSVLEDTVGAVACDGTGCMAAGVSSGGLLLKYPGRVGEAAVFGAGVWAYSPQGASFGVACSVSGTGEQIIRAALARSLSEALCASWTSPVPSESSDTHGVIQSTFEKFCNACRSRGDDDPRVGVLVLTKEQGDPPVEGADGDNPAFTCRLWCAFTTPSMAIAYASSADRKPRALVLRRPDPGLEPLNTAANPVNHIFITALPLTRA